MIPAFLRRLGHVCRALLILIDIALCYLWLATLYLIGGNVLNAVTLRKLPLDATGHAIPPTLPLSGTGGEDTDDPGTYCSPGNEAACNFNRQDWAVLLKLQAPASAEPAAASQ